MNIKDHYTKTFLKAAGVDYSDDDIKKYRSAWWWNVRNVGGLRLTDGAIEFIEDQSKIKTYKIKFSEQFAFTPQVLLWLDKFIDCPYYINNRSITVTKERVALELMLFAGDIRKFGHTRALAKRLSQESSPE